MQTPGAVLVRAQRAETAGRATRTGRECHLPGTHTAPASDEPLGTIGTVPDGSQRRVPVLQNIHPKRRL